MSPMFLLISAPSTLNDTFAAAVRAQSSLKQFRLHAELFGSGDGGPRNVQHDLVLRGTKFTLRVREGQTATRAPSDRAFSFGPTQAVGYDAAANERLVRNYPATLSKLDRVTYTVGPIDDDIRFVLRPMLLERFLANMAELSGWRIANGAKETTVLRVIDLGTIHTRTELRFAKSTHLLTYVSIKNSGKTSGWTLNYLTPTEPRLTIPGSARMVPAFTVEQPSPRYANRTARRITEGLIRAYRNLRQVNITVLDEMGRTAIAWNDDRFKESNSSGQYVYDGGRLTIYNATTKRTYSGNCATFYAPDYVVAAGVRVDYISRQYLRGRGPFRSLLSPDVMVKTSGTMDGPTGKSELLELVGGNFRSSWIVRQRDSLLDAVATSTMDGRGRPLLTTRRRFTYGAPNRNWSVTKAPRGKTYPLIPPRRR